MSQIQFTSTKLDDGQEFLTVFAQGRLLPPVDSTHPNFEEIKGLVLESLSGEFIDEDYLVSLFDVAQTIATKFESVSDRIKVGHGRILLDGEEIDNALTKQILRFMDEGVEDWKPLVAFFEKVLSNPNEHSREQLFEWLNRHYFTITSNGDIVGYKGVASDGQGGYQSISSGKEQVLVDGEPHTGKIPNPIGAEIEMARSLVHHDPSVGCSVGLHVGTYEYASSFSHGTVLEVHVNPRDVVSVPTDCNWQKVRTCRYKVVDVTEAKYDTAFLGLDADNSTDEEVENGIDLDLGLTDAPTIIYDGTAAQVGDRFRGTPQSILHGTVTVTGILDDGNLQLRWDDGVDDPSWGWSPDTLNGAELISRGVKFDDLGAGSKHQDEKGRFIG